MTVATTICSAVVMLATLAGVQPPPVDVVFKDGLKQYVMKGEDRDEVKVTVTLTAEAVVVRRNGTDATTIPYKTISGMTYDRRSKVRKMAMRMSPAQDHFLTIQFKIGDVGDVVEIEMGKNAAPNLTALLEARSGVKIDRVSS